MTLQPCDYIRPERIQDKRTWRWWGSTRIQRQRPWHPDQFCFCSFTSWATNQRRKETAQQTCPQTAAFQIQAHSIARCTLFTCHSEGATLLSVTRSSAVVLSSGETVVIDKNIFLNNKIKKRKIIFEKRLPIKSRHFDPLQKENNKKEIQWQSWS